MNAPQEESRPRREGGDDIGEDVAPIATQPRVTWAEIHAAIYGCSPGKCRGSALVRDIMSRYKAAEMAERGAA